MLCLDFFFFLSDIWSLFYSDLFFLSFFDILSYIIFFSLRCFKFYWTISISISIFWCFLWFCPRYILLFFSVYFVLGWWNFWCINVFSVIYMLYFSICNFLIIVDLHFFSHVLFSRSYVYFLLFRSSFVFPFTLKNFITLFSTFLFFWGWCVCALYFFTFSVICSIFPHIN